MAREFTNDNQFLRVHQQGRRRRSPNPNAFVALPSKLVDKIGLYTHKGVRVDAAILSTFAYYAQKSRKRNEFTIGSDHKVIIQNDQFALSVLRAAENLWARWFHLPSDNAQFDRFYQRIQKAAGRLRDKNLIQWVAWLDDKDKRTRGSIWTLKNTPLEWFIGVLPHCESSMVTVMRSTRDDYVLGSIAGYELTNVADLIGSAFANDNISMFTSAEACYSVHDRKLYMDYMSWTRAIASEGAAGNRYVSVGAVRPEDVGKKNPASFLYWFVLDIDRGDPVEAHEDTLEILCQLEDYGVPLNDLIISFTGGKGFHVRIPSGMFDNPVFRSVEEAHKVVTTLFDQLLDKEVDPKVFDPRQLIRIVGSKRNTGADYSIYTRAFLGTEFLDMSFEDCLKESMIFQPASLADPRNAAPVSELVVALMSASDMTRRASFPQFNIKNELLEDGDGSVVRAALAGVSQGDEWHPPKNGKYYIGRNYAMFIAACYLIRHHEGDEYQALEAMQTVNASYDPPLPRREVRSCMASASRTVSRDNG